MSQAPEMGPWKIQQTTNQNDSLQTNANDWKYVMT